MPRLLLFSPCQLATVDSSTNLLSLINVVEAVFMPQFPGAIADLTVVAQWRRSEDESGTAMVQKLELLGPDEQVVLAIETPFIFQNIGQRVINRISGVPIATPGNHELQVFVKPQASESYPEQPSGRYPILIQTAPAAQLNLRIGPAQQL